MSLSVVPDQPEVTALPAGGLRGYVAAVADSLGLSVAGVHHEVTDTATAYIALTERSRTAPDRDLMLTWTDRTGWTLAIEPGRPGQASVVLARLAGDPLPTAAVVAKFVDQVLAGRPIDPAPVSGPATLADRLAGYQRGHGDPSPSEWLATDGPRARPERARHRRLDRP
ncbi:MAG TPA: DUF6292 family protein [Pseudonocardiaceae bacterium]|nr:DUF6292 family protein [Pseudonocardiaceae bacterium]